MTTKETKEEMFKAFDLLRNKAMEEVDAETAVCLPAAQAIGDRLFKMMEGLTAPQQRIVLCAWLSSYVDSKDDLHYTTVMLGIFAELRAGREPDAAG